jgi:hypothetical protein
MNDIVVPLGTAPEIEEIAADFNTASLKEPEARQASMACARLAQEMILRLRSGPDLMAGLVTLLEARSCFIRQALARKAAERDAQNVRT